MRRHEKSKGHINEMKAREKSNRLEQMGFISVRSATDIQVSDDCYMSVYNYST